MTDPFVEGLKISNIGAWLAFLVKSLTRLLSFCHTWFEISETRKDNHIQFSLKIYCCFYRRRWCCKVVVGFHQKDKTLVDVFSNCSKMLASCHLTISVVSIFWSFFSNFKAKKINDQSHWRIFYSILKKDVMGIFIQIHSKKYRFFLVGH